MKIKPRKVCKKIKLIDNVGFCKLFNIPCKCFRCNMVKNCRKEGFKCKYLKNQAEIINTDEIENF